MSNSSRLTSRPRVSKPDRDVLSDYFRHRSSGLRPGIPLIVQSLKACRKLRDFSTGRRIHRDVAETRECANLVVATALLDLYAECGSLVNAEQVIETIQHRDVFAWTVIIQAYAKLGKGELAFSCYQSMLDAGCSPDRVTLLAALKACITLAENEAGRVDSRIRKRSLENGKLVHAQARSTGDDQDLFVASSLVDMYAKCGSMDDASVVFESMRHRNEVSWNSMILGFVQNGQSEVGLEFFARMLNEGCSPSVVTVVAALKACVTLAEKFQGIEGKAARMRCLEKGKQIYSLALHCCCKDLVLEVVTTLIDLHTKCGSLVEALRLFEGIIKQAGGDVTLWSCMILGCAQNGESKLALELFSRMQQQDHCLPDSTTFVAALNACSRAEFLETGRSIHREAEQRGFVNSFVRSALVDMYFRCGSSREARAVFDASHLRDVVLWNCIIQGYAHDGSGDQALKLYLQMQEAGCKPDALTFVAALKACSSLAALETGRMVHSEVRRAGVEGDAFVANTLVDFYGKCGSMVEAEEVFRSVHRKNVVTWSALISGYASQGDLRRASELLQGMREERLKPDEITFLSMLAACSHVGEVDRGKEFLEEMLSGSYPLVPQVEHYTCVVDMLGRANRLHEAAQVLEKMSCEANVSIWMALLAGCWRWRAVRVGEIAFREATRLDPRATSAYVLMSNLYAAAGMHTEAAAVRINIQVSRTSSFS